MSNGVSKCGHRGNNNRSCNLTDFERCDKLGSVKLSKIVSDKGGLALGPSGAKPSLKQMRRSKPEDFDHDQTEYEYMCWKPSMSKLGQAEAWFAADKTEFRPVVIEGAESAEGMIPQEEAEEEEGFFAEIFDPVEESFDKLMDGKPDKAIEKLGWERAVGLGVTGIVGIVLLVQLIRWPVRAYRRSKQRKAEIERKQAREAEAARQAEARRKAIENQRLHIEVLDEEITRLWERMQDSEFRDFADALKQALSYSKGAEHIVIRTDDPSIAHLAQDVAASARRVAEEALSRIAAEQAKRQVKAEMKGYEALMRGDESGQRAAEDSAREAAQAMKDLRAGEISDDIPLDLVLVSKPEGGVDATAEVEAEAETIGTPGVDGSTPPSDKLQAALKELWPDGQDKSDTAIGEIERETDVEMDRLTVKKTGLLAEEYLVKGEQMDHVGMPLEDATAKLLNYAAMQTVLRQEKARKKGLSTDDSMNMEDVLSALEALRKSPVDIKDVRDFLYDHYRWLGRDQMGLPETFEQFRQSRFEEMSMQAQAVPDADGKAAQTGSGEAGMSRVGTELTGLSTKAQSTTVVTEHELRDEIEQMEAEEVRIAEARAGESYISSAVMADDDPTFSDKDKADIELEWGRKGVLPVSESDGRYSAARVMAKAIPAISADDSLKELNNQTKAEIAGRFSDAVQGVKEFAKQYYAGDAVHPEGLKLVADVVVFMNCDERFRDLVPEDRTGAVLTYVEAVLRDTDVANRYFEQGVELVGFTRAQELAEERAGRNGGAEDSARARAEQDVDRARREDSERRMRERGRKGFK